MTDTLDDALEALRSAFVGTGTAVTTPRPRRWAVVLAPSLLTMTAGPKESSGVVEHGGSGGNSLSFGVGVEELDVVIRETPTRSGR